MLDEGTERQPGMFKHDFAGLKRSRSARYRVAVSGAVVLT
jgi:hypothetical protein